ncbi:MAG: Abi family protein [Dehalococcoidia bacterium]|nr:Abi family protein [Dehalococcoidia bacterium]
MNYSEFEKAISIPRLEKYLRACKGNKRDALRLYRYNIKLCQRFFGLLSIFEVVFRNSINAHFKNHLGDPNWIVTQSTNGFLVRYQEPILSEYKKLMASGNYTNDRLLSTLSFGVWTFIFSRKCYKNSGKTSLQIFTAKPFGTNQSTIYNDLDEIRSLRNRIAHHESLCFNRNGDIDLTYAQNILHLIQSYLVYLGYKPTQLLFGIEHPSFTIEKIYELSHPSTSRRECP